ncbi:transport permease protein [Egicoccus halophilus]|uniref:Transport permease protein n=1 Tax=Egicoccus halophilus TaxID=1670830 RepID=A0A8J3EVH7_9ACTN|nr:transport permease protein [Egicoccus halophilus]
MGGTLRTVQGLLLRDLRVLRRELWPFVARAVAQPLLFVFVFAYVFPRIGQGIGAPAQAGAADFATVLVPGLVAVAVVFQGITSVALPLSQEFGATREIEDRILAPVRVEVVALTKVAFGALQSLLAGAVVLPLVALVPAGEVDLAVPRPGLLVLVAVLAAVLSGALGLALGTRVNPRQIGLMFSLVVLPLTFLGAVYYPWTSLAAVPWLQWLVLLNPLVYVSEGLRAALTPAVDAMPPVAFLTAMAVAVALLLTAGLGGFVRRTVG